MARGHPDYLVTAGKTSAGDLKVDWEFLIDNGTRIVKNTQAVNTTDTLYTVPSGKVFYLTYASLGFLNRAATEASVSLKIDDAIIMSIVTPSIDDAHNNETYAPVIPIRLIAGEAIKLQSGSADTLASGQIGGYEIDT